MTESELRTHSNEYNHATQEKQFVHELYNCTRNFGVIMDAIESGQAKDLSDEPKREGEKCIIIGSGPSLDEALPYLKDWKGSIICTSSHASTLVYHGIIPDYLLVLDPFCYWDHIDGINWVELKTKLVTCPTAWPDLIYKWPNEILLYRQDMAGQSNFYSKDLNIMFSEREHIEGGEERDFQFVPYIRTQMTMFSCSPPAELFVADALKYDTCYLCGVDFAYNTEKARFTAYYKSTGEWVKREFPYKKGETKANPNNPKETEITTDNGLLSTPQMLFYKKNMFSAMRLSMQNIFVVGKGAIHELRTITPEQLIKDQDKKAARMDAIELKGLYERYLAKQGGFVIVSEREGKEAYTFIESEFPDFELPDYMIKMKLVYKCHDCGAELKANDYETPMDMIHAFENAVREKDTANTAVTRAEIVKHMKEKVDTLPDHNGEECPQCKKGKMKSQFKIDVKREMKRYTKYQNWIGW